MLTIGHSEKKVVLSFNGINRINVLNHEFLKDALVRILDKTEKKEIFIDLEGISFIDSAGFGMLMELLKLAENKEKRILFCNLSDEIMELIDLMNLQHQFMSNEQLCEVAEF